MYHFLFFIADVFRRQGIGLEILISKSDVISFRLSVRLESRDFFPDKFSVFGVFVTRYLKGLSVLGGENTHDNSFQNINKCLGLVGHKRVVYYAYHNRI